MSLFTYDRLLGKLTPSAPVTVIAGFDWEITIALTEAAAASDFQLVIVKSETDPTVLAATEDFDRENDTTWTAVMDLNDTRLATHLATTTAPAALLVQFAGVLDGHSLSPAKATITVQRNALTGPVATEGGPSWYTQGQTNAHIAAAITAALDGLPDPDPVVTTLEAQTGTEAAYRRWSPLRVKQAIDALAPTASVIDGAHGGTGVANTGRTITIGSDLILNGTGDSLTLSMAGTTSLTLPTTGTLATTSDVNDGIAALVGAAPTALNTLVEIAAALNDDANLYGTLISAIGGKADAGAIANMVEGPASSTANRLVLFNGTSGKLIAEDPDLYVDAGSGELVGVSKRARFLNFVIEPVALVFSSTLDVDFSLAGLRTLTLTGDTIFSGSNGAAGRSVAVRMTASGADCLLTFPGAWVFVGAAAPSALADGKTAVLSLTSFGTTDAEVIAAYAAQP
jgi:hypothetical protein